MSELPGRVVRWYTGLPTWGKVLGFVLFLVLIVGAVAIWLLSRAKPARGGAGDPGEVAVKGWVEYAEEHHARAGERDRELAAEAEAERAKRAALDEESAEDAERRDAGHEAIDGADSFADVDRAIDEAFRRR